jgi:hypothetical protein
VRAGTGYAESTASHERLRSWQRRYHRKKVVDSVVQCGDRGTERRLTSLDWHWQSKAPTPSPRLILRGRNAIAITTNFRACPRPRTASIHPLPTTPLPAEAGPARLPKRRWRRRFDIKMQSCTASGTELLATRVLCWCIVGTFVYAVKCGAIIVSVWTILIGERRVLE